MNNEFFIMLKRVFKHCEYDTYFQVIIEKCHLDIGPFEHGFVFSLHPIDEKPLSMAYNFTTRLRN